MPDRHPTPLFARSTALAIILGVAVALGLQLWSSFRQEVSHAKQLTQAMAESTAQQVGGSMRGIDGLLEEMAAVARAGQWLTPPQRQRLAGRLETFPEILWVGLVSATGWLDPQTIPDIGLPPGGRDVSDLDYYLAFPCAPGSPPKLGVPRLLDGRRILHVSLAIPQPGGGCQGLVVAALDPDYYAALLEPLLLDAKGGAGIFAHRQAVAYVPDHAGHFAKDDSDSTLFGDWLPKARHGVGRSRDLMDGQVKFLAYRELPRYGLVVTSGLSARQALAGWFRQAACEAGAFLLFALVTFLWARQADLREGRLIRHQAGLEQAVAERTAALSAAKLLAERRAERLAQVNQRLTHLTRVTAHHLQEPVRPLVCFSQLVRREMAGNCPPAVEEHLRFIERASLGLKGVLQAFHRYTSLLATVPRPETIELNSLVEAALIDLTRDLERQEGVLRVGPLPRVRIDRRMMETVLRELFRNALTFRHPARPPVLTVEGGRGGGEWWLAVSDNGRGIPPESLHLLFEPFSRLSPDGPPPHGPPPHGPPSHGLGLAICREVAEVHGGSIRCSSDAQGTRFTLVLPDTLPEPPAPAPLALGGAKASGGEAHGRERPGEQTNSPFPEAITS